MLGTTPRVSYSVGLGYGSRICTSDKFSGDAENTDWGLLWEALF